jgi:hypothetical protein
MSSTQTQVAMPQIERSVVDVQGVGLVTEWIAEMDAGCP